MTQYLITLINAGGGELDQQTIEVVGNPYEDDNHDAQVSVAIAQAIVCWTFRNGDSIRVNVRD